MKKDKSEINRKVIWEDGNQVIFTYPDSPIVYHEFHTPSSPMCFPFINSQNDLKKPFSGYVINVVRGNLIPFEDLCWVENFDLCQLTTAGIFHIAYISTESIYSHLELEKNVKSAFEMVKIKICREEAEALAWFRSQGIA